MRQFTLSFGGAEFDETPVIKEKLIVCLAIVKRKSTKIDDVIETCKDTYKTFMLTNEELNFLAKDAYPQSYIKYIKNEDWYNHTLK